MHPMLNVAIKAARAAGKIINRAELDLDTLKVGTKNSSKGQHGTAEGTNTGAQHDGPADFVTETDQAAETAIIQTLKLAYPHHAILAEESGASGQSQYEWVIDPIDGTANFVHGYPHYAISIALRVNGQLQQAVVFNPATNELFTASKGEGAFLNNRRIRVSKRHRHQEFLIGMAFPGWGLPNASDIKQRMMNLSDHTAGVRKSGSAVLDLAYVACGRLDGYQCYGLKPWDLAAGVLLVTEAGGLVTDPMGEGTYMETGHAVAGNPKALQYLLSFKNQN